MFKMINLPLLLEMMDTKECEILILLKVLNNIQKLKKIQNPIWTLPEFIITCYEFLKKKKKHDPELSLNILTSSLEDKNSKYG